jgi:DNA-binding transcriptional regulator YiaG
MNHDSADPKQKRERFQQLTQNPKVKIGKVFAADVRKSRIHPTVKKLTAWRKANRLSQPKAIAVLGEYYFHITFASLRSWEEGRRFPNPHTAGSLKNFCPTIGPWSAPKNESAYKHSNARCRNLAGAWWRESQ